MNKLSSYSCSICGCSNLNVYQLAVHIFKSHSISMEMYCRNYIFSPTEGVCPECGEPSKFLSIWRGFAKTCGSKKCYESHKSKTMVVHRATNYNLTDALEKTRATNMVRYGVEHIAQLESHKQKIFNSNISRYGNRSTLQLKEVANARQESLLNPSVNKKRREWWYNCGQSIIDRINTNRKKSNMKRYGILSVSQIPSVMEKIRKSNEAIGMWLPREKHKPFNLYRKLVNKETKKHKVRLLMEWDGLDYYTKEPVLGLSNSDRISIDHKISVFYGFSNSIPPDVIGAYSNLCVCSFSSNARKNRMTESEFNEKMWGNRVS